MPWKINKADGYNQIQLITLGEHNLYNNVLVNGVAYNKHSNLKVIYNSLKIFFCYRKALSSD